MHRHHRHHHHHGGWGWRGGWGWGGPYRRIGIPMFRRGMGGSGLLGDLMAGGVGYMIGRRQAAKQQYQQYPPQYQQAPMVQGSNQNNQLAQLRLLGQLRAEGVLTNAEFEAQKRKILNGF